MTYRAFSFYPRIMVYLILLAWAITLDSRAAEPINTNQPVSPEATLPSLVLTNAEQVHLLSRQQAAGGQHVLIRGVITCALPEFGAAVVQDDTAGIYLNNWNPPLGAPPRVGESVEVEGVTESGEFAPRVHVNHITRLGTTELPSPVRAYWDQLINGSLDTEFVEIEGIVITVRTDGVTLLTHGGSVNVLIFGSTGETNSIALKPYENALIRLRGCLFASWNGTTHEVNVNEVRMFAPSVTVVEPGPADSFAIKSKNVSDLLQFDPEASALRRVKVFGQIVHESDGEYYAMDRTNGFRFVPKEPVSLEVGDQVEVAGYPGLTGPSPVLKYAYAKKIGVDPLPDARPLDADNMFLAENDATRVSIRAVLLNLSRDQQRLELQAGLQRFVARLDGGATAASGRTLSDAGLDLPPGSRLELTGVYAGDGGNRTTHANVTDFELLLNSPADIQVLGRPPFWTLPRLLVLVGALLGVLGLALIWIRLLHHKVQQRTLQLQKEMHEREQAEHLQSLAQERARIARDLHDDLGSSLTEITMLATAGPGQKSPAEDATERMETIAGKSRSLVRALDEIVWVVDPERDTLASVAGYLGSYAEEYLAGLKVACRVHLPNSFPDQAVPGEVRHHLFLAVKEALNNAVHHGGTTEIGFQIRVLENQLWISITDNGSGFDTSAHPIGHGLLNLRNRLEQLHGQCELKSSPGAGTTVSLRVPLSIPNHLK